ncbi:unnamed protein product, partial [Callosobruchus maculatus]
MEQLCGLYLCDYKVSMMNKKLQNLITFGYQRLYIALLSETEYLDFSYKYELLDVPFLLYADDI